MTGRDPREGEAPEGVDAGLVEAPGGGPRASDGRRPGVRGQATRRRLLECTSRQLSTATYRDLKVVDIAREAGTSPATFYQYFADVEAAVAALARDMAAGWTDRLVDLVREQDWEGPAAVEAVEEVVAGFFAFWEEHRPLMRVIDLVAAEGDEHIRPVRMEMLRAFAAELALVVEGAVRSGDQPVDTDPMTVASVVVTLLVNVAIQRYAFSSVGTEHLDPTVVRIVHTALTGRTAS